MCARWWSAADEAEAAAAAAARHDLRSPRLVLSSLTEGALRAPAPLTSVSCATPLLCPRPPPTPAPFPLAALLSRPPSSSLCLVRCSPSSHALLRVLPRCVCAQVRCRHPSRPIPRRARRSARPACTSPAPAASAPRPLLLRHRTHCREWHPLVASLAAPRPPPVLVPLCSLRSGPLSRGFCRLVQARVGAGGAAPAVVAARRRCVGLLRSAL